LPSPGKNIGTKSPPERPKTLFYNILKLNPIFRLGLKTVLPCKILQTENLLMQTSSFALHNNIVVILAFVDIRLSIH